MPLRYRLTLQNVSGAPLLLSTHSLAGLFGVYGIQNFPVRIEISLEANLALEIYVLSKSCREDSESCVTFVVRV